jgi:pimeloyl-ACP methyl ester carboxylesterase
VDVDGDHVSEGTSPDPYPCWTPTADVEGSGDAAAMSNGGRERDEAPAGWVWVGGTRLVALLLLVALLAVLARPVGLRVVALVTVAEGLGLDVPRPLAPVVDRVPDTIGGVEADRYARSVNGVSFDDPAIVLVPGAAPAGRGDDRVVAIATALARASRTVVVPELEVFGEVLVPDDVDRLVDVAGALSRDHGPVVLAGLSFGGSLSLVAADDPRLADRVALVATFGAYADLAGVVQAVTTGVSLVDGERIGWDPDPRAAEVVEAQLVGLLGGDDREEVEATLAGERSSADLAPPLRAVVEVLDEDDPARVVELLARTPPEVQDRIAEVSPVTVAPDLQVPIVALHARDDPVIPYGELVRLEAAYPQTRALTLATFDHVGLGDGDTSWWVTARDLWRTSRFVDLILAAG